MPPKRKSGAFKSNIPWENVGANALRALCKDVGGPTSALRTKEAMISFLWDVEQHGLEVAAENVSQHSPEPPKPAAPTTPTTRTRTTSLKRKKPEPAPEDDEGEEAAPAQSEADDDALPYNTRNKGQKRVRVTAPPLPKMSSVRRKSTASRTAKKDVEMDEPEEAPGSTSVTPVKRGRGRPKKSSTTAAAAKADAASGPVVKRGRGRPRKSAAPTPKKAGKQVFDGIELKRARTKETTEDVDADGEPDEETLAAPSGETSSLGSSNKENNPELAFTAPEEVAAAEAASAQMSLVDAINLSNNPA